MKLEIFNKAPEPVEKVVRLRLVSMMGNEIALIAVDENGKMVDHGCLLGLDSDTRTVYRNRDVNKSLGFNLDDEGRIWVEK